MSTGRIRPVALIGLRCVGKTSVGREVARLGNARFLDLDEEILAAWQRDHPSGGPGAGQVGHVLTSLGVEGFRELELRVLWTVLEGARAERTVLATGGGCVETPAVRALLAEKAWCVWLREDLGRLVQRLERDPDARPALTSLDPAAEFQQLARERGPYFEALARVTIDCEGQSVDAVAERTLRELPDPWPEGSTGLG